MDLADYEKKPQESNQSLQKVQEGCCSFELWAWNVSDPTFTSICVVFRFFGREDLGRSLSESEGARHHWSQALRFDYGRQHQGNVYLEALKPAIGPISKEGHSACGERDSSLLKKFLAAVQTTWKSTTRTSVDAFYRKGLESFVPTQHGSTGDTEQNRISPHHSQQYWYHASRAKACQGLPGSEGGSLVKSETLFGKFTDLISWSWLQSAKKTTTRRNWVLPSPMNWGWRAPKIKRTKLSPWRSSNRPQRRTLGYYYPGKVVPVSSTRGHANVKFDKGPTSEQHVLSGNIIKNIRNDSLPLRKSDFNRPTVLRSLTLKPLKTSIIKQLGGLRDGERHQRTRGKGAGCPGIVQFIDHGSYPKMFSILYFNGQEGEKHAIWNWSKSTKSSYGFITNYIRAKTGHQVSLCLKLGPMDSSLASHLITFFQEPTSKVPARSAKAACASAKDRQLRPFWTILKKGHYRPNQGPISTHVRNSKQKFVSHSGWANGLFFPLGSETWRQVPANVRGVVSTAKEAEGASVHDIDDKLKILRGRPSRSSESVNRSESSRKPPLAGTNRLQGSDAQGGSSSEEVVQEVQEEIRLSKEQHIEDQKESRRKKWPKKSTGQRQKFNEQEGRRKVTKKDQNRGRKQWRRRTKKKLLKSRPSITTKMRKRSRMMRASKKRRRKWGPRRGGGKSRTRRKLAKEGEQVTCAPSGGYQAKRARLRIRRWTGESTIRYQVHAIPMAMSQEEKIFRLRRDLPTLNPGRRGFWQDGRTMVGTTAASIKGPLGATSSTRSRTVLRGRRGNVQRGHHIRAARLERQLLRSVLFPSSTLHLGPERK